MNIYYNPEQHKFGVFRYLTKLEDGEKVFDNTRMATSGEDRAENVVAVVEEVLDVSQIVSVVQTVNIVHENLFGAFSGMALLSSDIAFDNYMEGYDKNNKNEYEKVQAAAEEFLLNSEAEFLIYDIDQSKDLIIEYNNFLRAIKDNWDKNWGDNDLNITPADGRAIFL